MSLRCVGLDFMPLDIPDALFDPLSGDDLADWE